MIEILVVAALFLASLAVNAIISRWTVKKVLGIDISIAKHTVLVTARSLAALLAGFSVGYGVSLGLDVEATDKIVKIGGLLLVTGLSFLVYWTMLGKMTNTTISLWSMSKTVAIESVVLFAAVVGISVTLSTFFVIFGVK